jgi:nitrogen fixation protein NifB
MPLISDPAHGTHYGLTGQRGPTPMELKELQDQLSGGAKLMRHCRQCRADAVGMLGEDRGQEFNMDLLPEITDYNSSKRVAYQAVVAEARGEQSARRAAASAAVAASETEAKILVAVATKGGGRINQHFGHATEFQVYEVSAAGISFGGHRKVEKYCAGGWGEDATLDSVIAALEGIKIVLCAKIGDCPKDTLAAAGIEVTGDHAYEWIEAGIAAWHAAAHPSAARLSA